VRRDDGMRGCRPRHDPARFPISHFAGVGVMKNFVAPLSFTIAFAWVVVLFVLVSSQ
jgi:hypothetical protein